MIKSEICRVDLITTQLMTFIDLHIERTNGDIKILCNNLYFDWNENLMKNWLEFPND